MKKITTSSSIILLFVITVSISSCNKQEDKEPSKKDSILTNASNPTSQVSLDDDDDQADAFLPHAPGQVMPTPSQLSEMNRNAPIGSIPILRSQQLTEFHPRLPDFTIAKADARDEEKESQSIILFKFKADTSRTIRSTIMDANEMAASKQLMQMAEMQKKKQETKVVGGESITSYYTEINGTPAVKAYIPSKNLATLFVFVGDHRAIALRESNVRSADHLIEAAKTIDFKKFESLTRK